MNLKYHEQSMNNQHQLMLLLDYLKLKDYRFTTISPVSHEIVNSRPENKIANGLSDVFGWNRPFKRESIDVALFDLMLSANIAINVGDYWKSQLRVSSIDGLLFLHSAYPTLSNEAVFLGPDTYRFANVIHQFFATRQQSIGRAVDIGTGSGVGAVLLAKALTKLKFKTKTEIIAVDINDDALNLARVNISAADIQHVKITKSDLLNNVKGNFDLIIANPPYLLDKAERAYRHGGGQLGADLSLAIVDTAIERLNANGTLLLYTGVAIVDGHDAFLAEVEVKLNVAGFTYEYKEIDPDIFGEELSNDSYSMADRIAAVVLTAQKPAEYTRV
jgi:methylase of polypeptide subunit release factors